MRTGLAVLLSAIAALACTTLTTSVNYDRSLDFSRSSTFAFQKGTPARKESTQKRIEGVVGAAIEGRGLTSAGSEKPGLHVFTHAVVESRQRLAAAVSAAGFEPPRWKSGPLPEIPRQTVAWGQCLLEVTVSPGGEVEKTTVLRSSPPFAEKLQEAVRGWRFEPARVDGRPSPVRVLVGAVFRPPTLPDAPGLGEPPRDVAEPSDWVPFPTSIVAPLYPPRALGDGVVLLEVTVGDDGNVRTATVLRSAPGFDDSAMQGALQWRFRPARRYGSPVSARAILAFAFRQPVVSKPRLKRPAPR